MLSSSSITQVPDCHLYEVVAHGVRLSPMCERGHEMVMDLLQRLGLFDGAQAHRGWLPALVSGGTSPILFNPTVPVQRAANETALPTAPETVEPEATCVVGSAVCPPTAPSAPTRPGPDRMRLSQMIDLHLRNMKRGKSGEQSATRERGYILDLMKQVLGDKAVDDITVNDAATFADFLAVWPVYRHNHPDFKHMSATSIAAKAKAEKMRPIHSATQGKHIKAIKAFFHWCVESGGPVSLS